MIQAMKNLNLLQKMVCHRQSKSKRKYNENNSVKCRTESNKTCLWAYSDAYILAPGDITVTARGDNGSNADVAFKICAPFYTCKTEINDVFIDAANDIFIAMPMSNLIKYSNNYSHASVSLWQF